MAAWNSDCSTMDKGGVGVGVASSPGPVFYKLRGGGGGGPQLIKNRAWDEATVGGGGGGEGGVLGRDGPIIKNILNLPPNTVFVFIFNTLFLKKSN